MLGRKQIIGLAIGSAILIVVALAYRAISSRVNLVGILARGGEAKLTVPDGFEVSVFAEGLEGPRFMQFSPEGELYVAERGADRIVVLKDADKDGRVDSRTVFAEDLPSPHSVSFHDGAWYVGVPSGVLRLTDLDGDGKADERVTLIDDYPTSGHSTRTVEFLGDGRMVVSVGSSCNVCEEVDARRAAVVVYDDADAGGERLFASGLRNAVGLAVHPVTGELWATNNGRDMMGDDLPPETVYRLFEGADYGWPFCHSGNIIDPDLGFDGACANVEPPVVEMQAHSAPLGLVFYKGEAFPEEYHGDLFIAFHGSWNRSIPTGYKIVRLPFEGTTPGAEVVDFATGWLADDFETVTGRPVGLAIGPDGALYVSDDTAGFIYRIIYGASLEEVELPNTAEVLSVHATGEPNAYSFAVEVVSPDAGCDQYADWWEVISESGELLFRRTLLHSHVGEQPFTRSGGPVSVDENTVVIVRAHMHPGGYGTQSMRGSAANGFEAWSTEADFAVDLEHADPQPPDCGF